MATFGRTTWTSFSAASGARPPVRRSSSTTVSGPWYGTARSRPATGPNRNTCRLLYSARLTRTCPGGTAAAPATRKAASDGVSPSTVSRPRFPSPIAPSAPTADAPDSSGRPVTVTSSTSGQEVVYAAATTGAVGVARASSAAGSCGRTARQPPTGANASPQASASPVALAPAAMAIPPRLPFGTLPHFIYHRVPAVPALRVLRAPEDTN